ncbi:gas vesicle protein GvpO [Amycolatopsis pithecellobii]|uniref:Gas vesicle protein n=1 Tax=Amycolatopsis pithecellobii TaxID=664692 RepID=A0A6N7YN98_9PSEU|nr:gas vesicle protein GvpO [Amycolatopsis pithecellobii]MTD54467.1 gas vesicle protein [Amycolatopsis pithecellobii]
MAANSRDGTEPRREELTASEAGAKALQHLGELVSSSPLGVTSVEPAEDGWLVEVEVLEERRIPSSSDILAIYRVELDLDGELLAYRRLSQYARGKAGAGNGNGNGVS